MAWRCTDEIKKKDSRCKRPNKKKRWNEKKSFYKTHYGKQRKNWSVHLIHFWCILARNGYFIWRFFTRFCENERHFHIEILEIYQRFKWQCSKDILCILDLMKTKKIFCLLHCCVQILSDKQIKKNCIKSWPIERNCYCTYKTNYSLTQLCKWFFFLFHFKSVENTVVLEKQNNAEKIHKEK